MPPGLLHWCDGYREVCWEWQVVFVHAFHNLRQGPKWADAVFCQGAANGFYIVVGDHFVWLLHERKAAGVALRCCEL